MNIIIIRYKNFLCGLIRLNMQGNNTLKEELKF